MRKYVSCFLCVLVAVGSLICWRYWEVPGPVAATVIFVGILGALESLGGGVVDSITGEDQCN
jgi:hypothetical protein